MTPNWPKVKLGEVLKVQNGFAFDSKLFSFESGMPLIRIRDLKNGINTETKYIGEFKPDYIVNQGDFLIGMDGEFRCAEWLGEPSLLNQRVCRLIDFDNQLDKRFLYYGINKFLKDIEDVTSFATVKHISSRQILEIEFPLPPLDEQKRIVAKLDKTFFTINMIRATELNKSLEIQAAYKSEFTRLIRRNVEQWPYVKIGDSCEYENGKAHEPFISDNGQFQLVTSKFVSTEGRSYARVSRCLSPLVEGDVVFVLSDVPNGKTLAKAYLVNKDESLTLNQRVMRLRSNCFTPEFLYLQLNRHPDLLAYDNGESQTNLKLRQILDCNLACPPLKVQEQVARKILGLRNLTETYWETTQTRLKEIDALKSKVLQSAFVGDF